MTQQQAVKPDTIKPPRPPRFQRFRIWIATKLCRGTPCMVVRSGPALDIYVNAQSLAKYVQQSGALQDPKRVKAYRVVLRFAFAIGVHSQNLLHGLLTPARASREEKNDGGQEKEEAQQAQA